MKNENTDDTQRYNKEQLAAIRHEPANILVLAGAGTGKTTTIMGRVEHLVKSGVPPDRIILLTFTRRAAGEMISRLHNCIGGLADKIWAGTFHAFALHHMRAHPKVFGIGNSVILDPDDQDELMKLARAPFVEKGKTLPRAGQIVELYSYARNTTRSFPSYLEKFTSHSSEVCQKLVSIVHAYESRKRAKGYLDFDDLLHMFAEKLKNDSDFQSEMKVKYDHILVDEMQDTNPVQWRILENIHGPAHLFCVGDDAQSIYAFRGADFRNVHDFAKRIPEAKVLKLEENYRSGQPILDIANWLLSDSELDYGKKLRAHRTGKFPKPLLVDFDNMMDEADWITDDITERHESGDDWKRHMVLSRTIGDLRAVEASCIQKKIPCEVIGGISLFQSAHVKDLLAVIRATNSHLDELAWMRVLTMYTGIGEATASRIIASMTAKKTIQEAAREYGERYREHSAPLGVITMTARLWDDPAKAITDIADNMDPLMKERYDNWESRKNDFILLSELAKRHPNLKDFLDTYSIDPIYSPKVRQLSNGDSVTLITVHSAKGTEAKTCYVIAAQPGRYPHIMSMGNPEDEEEERRVLYVAMTRAKDNLILTRYSDSGMFYARGGTDGPYHLRDIPEKLVKAKNKSSRKETQKKDVGSPDGWVQGFTEYEL